MAAVKVADILQDPVGWMEYCHRPNRGSLAALSVWHCWQQRAVE
jgi:hypothetical protein